MRKICFVIAALFAFGLTLHAQQQFVWAQYGLSFQGPADFEVIEEEDESFSAGNDFISLDIEAVDYTGVTFDQLGEILANMAAETGMHEAEVGEIPLSAPLAGACIQGVVDDENTAFFLLMNVEKKIALFGAVVYEEAYEQQVANILTSFTAQ